MYVGGHTSQLLQHLEPTAGVVTFRASYTSQRPHKGQVSAGVVTHFGAQTGYWQQEQTGKGRRQW
jgi:hypothetical protein